MNRDNFFSPRNPIDSKTEAIIINDPDENNRRIFKSALVAMGFREIPDKNTAYDTFLPCPLGTFSNFSSRGAEGCIECPPGILHGRLKRQFLATTCFATPSDAEPYNLKIQANAKPLFFSLNDKHIQHESERLGLNQVNWCIHLK